MRYQDLIFGRFHIREVLEAVNDLNWQRFRISLKGLTTETKLRKLRDYLNINNLHKHKIQVTNYVYALKRGGLLK